MDKEDIKKKLAELAYSRGDEDDIYLEAIEDDNDDLDYPAEAEGESHPFVEIKGSVSSTNRNPTPTELAESITIRDKLKVLKAWEKEIQKLIRDTKKTCTHTVSVDTAGFAYDHRRCHGCGKDQGLV